ncbi:MAG TPA: glycosyltransferase family 1 protein [Thermodesulfobium narugense]|uniref:Glycosyltransferase involved in cell wall bisynthesis n=1 Tax=Thermodesulfobium acidiphilum TaxID=1794699 RepID=A0A2R4W242_THEAF|nr:glycosyltransferase family 4 protein [Thermodesulfobium acidiphilum]AWB10814.1 Glycosyltransferase involved in cell wall bisynthesis [Thermodesulfobium acidiphilum]PMP86514.1 MAG: glycosyltransferase [Thermodesulfobium narugense]HEM56486.1 glycosyltransferase family 1 protein [Thermodesulfobium narugense]
MNKLKILILGRLSPIDGNSVYVQEIKEKLDERGHSVHLLLFDEGEDEKDRSFLPYLFKTQPYIMIAPSTIRKLKDIVKSVKPDCIHISLTLSFLDFFIPDIFDDIPVIATFHPPFDKNKTLWGVFSQVVYNVYAPFLSNYDKIITLSSVQSDFLMEKGVKKEKLQIIPNGVDPIKYSPGYSDLKERLNADFLFLYLGRISPEKNVKVLCEAFLENNFPEKVKLLIVGDGIDLLKLKRDFNSENIIFFGEANQDRKQEIFRSSDVFVLPSSIEGLPLALLEAMSSKLMCIATNVGATQDALQDSGILLNPMKLKDELIHALKISYQNEELRSKFSSKARERIISNFNIFRQIQILEDVYYNVINFRKFLEKSKV